MRKSLLLMHLESLNWLNYRMNPDLFPVLQEIEQQCIVFDCYYSTATSTLMVITDLLYGGMALFESCESLEAIPTEYCYSSSLFDDLKEQGYETGIYMYPDGGVEYENPEKHAAGFQHQMMLLPDYFKYVAAFEEKMNHQPFALMACNYISNLTSNKYVDISRYGMDVGLWEAGYRCMDQCCGDLLKLLKDKKLMNDTVIIFYGDHGDDYWGHGAHSGLTHAIEPNNLLIHTPLFIWDGVYREKAEHDLRLLQTTDLRNIIMNLLNGKSVEELPARKYAVSRNEYAAQPVRAETFNKAYSVTDGRYLLMISVRGLEMYDTKMDPACHNNLLQFFDYENGILRSNVKPEMMRYHFVNYWNSKEQRILRMKFYELIKVLYDNVLELYIAGRRDEKSMRDEMVFEKISRNPL